MSDDSRLDVVAMNPSDPTSERRRPIHEDTRERGEKEYLVGIDSKEPMTIEEYLQGLTFQDKMNLLFGKGIVLGKSGTGEEKESKKTLLNAAKIAIGVSIMAVVIMISVQVANQSNANNQANLLNNAQKEELLSQALPTISHETILTSVERQLALYNNEELKKISDYLDMRGNRGATMTSIRMQKAKKENAYLYLAQNRPFFEDGESEEEIEEKLELYDKLEDKIIQSIVMSEEALSAFDGTGTTSILKSLVPKYNRF